MAVTTLYFSDTAAGAGDGTTWADRAAFVVSNALNTLITGFDFTSNSLLALVEGGKTYSITTSPSVTNTAPFPLHLRGCDSSGNELSPPDPDWTSDQPAFSSATLPTLEVTTNIAALNTTHTHVRCFRFTGSGNTTNPIVGSNIRSLDWCLVECSSALTTTSGAATPAKMSNSCVTATNATYSACTSTFDLRNVRLVGNSSASSGTRYGLGTTTATVRIVGVCAFNNVGGNLVSTSTSTGLTFYAERCTLVGGGGGIILPGTAATTTHSNIKGCMITGSSAYGIDLGTNTTPTNIVGNRLRDHTSGNITNNGSMPTTSNYTTDSDDATEYVDAASGDYRIKSGATIHGQGYGVSDQASSGGGGGLLTHPGMAGGMRG